jgi:hypothetical protein
MSAVGGFNNAGGQHSIKLILSTELTHRVGPTRVIIRHQNALMHYTEWELQVGLASGGNIYHPLQHNGSVCVIKRTSDYLC